MSAICAKHGPATGWDFCPECNPEAERMLAAADARLDDRDEVIRELTKVLEIIGGMDVASLTSVSDPAIRGILYSSVQIAADALAKARGEL